MPRNPRIPCPGSNRSWSGFDDDGGGVCIQAIVRLAQRLSPPSERQLAQFLGLGAGDTLRDSALSKFYSMVGETQADELRVTKEADGAPLHSKVRALLKLMMLEMQVWRSSLLGACVVPQPTKPPASASAHSHGS